MEHTLKSLIGCKINTNEGTIGEVEEFYFDDDRWIVRYLIVKTGSWLLGRTVLISPAALSKNSLKPGMLPVNLTKEQVENSPDIDTDEPVSRQQEIALYEHYGWDMAYGNGYFGGSYTLPGNSYPPFADEIALASAQENKKDDDLHLRSSKKVTGYHIHAVDGDIGHVLDFIVDDKDWKLKFIVADTHNWFGGKKVQIAIGHVKDIDWGNSKVLLDVTRVSIEKGKLFDEQQFSNPETEENIRVKMPVIPIEIH